MSSPNWIMISGMALVIANFVSIVQAQLNTAIGSYVIIGFLTSMCEFFLFAHVYIPWAYPEATGFDGVTDAAINAILFNPLSVVIVNLYVYKMLT